MLLSQPQSSQSNANLDAIFSALADPTRRAILTRLMEGEASVNELAEPFDMSQPAISKHLKVLERADLIERQIVRQRRPARLKAENLAQAVKWLEDFRNFWTLNLNELDTVLAELSPEPVKQEDPFANLKWSDEE